jgi:polysaccharide deacetylase family protein (PEP-CTERM system associated)
MQPTHAQQSHFFTVDVEEYFQVRALESVVSRADWLSSPTRVERNVDTLLSALGTRGVRGTFFVLGWIAEHRPAVVRAIVNAGHELGSHGYWHERVTCLDRNAFREDVRSSKRRLEDVGGTKVIGYRAPNFSIVPGGEWAFDILLEEGYAYDSSLFPIHRSGYGYPTSPTTPHLIPRATGSLAEFPLATTTIFRYPIPAAGGGYLRQFPLAVIQRAFRQATARLEPATFYIHPWEIDPKQPRLPVSVLNRIRHYRGLATALEKLELLLDEFRFTTIASHMSTFDSAGIVPPRAGAA